MQLKYLTVTYGVRAVECRTWDTEIPTMFVLLRAVSSLSSVFKCKQLVFKVQQAIDERVAVSG